MKMNRNKPIPEALVDKEQRERAVQCRDRCPCVQAGAGTGKTSLLVDRVLDILRSDTKMSMENLVVITFTEKASAELKERIRQELEKNVRKNPRLQRAIWNLDRACISTIHAFAAAILRERPVEVGIDPYFSILDEMGNNLLVDELWERWLALRMEEGAWGIRQALLPGITVEQMKKIATHLYNHRELLPLSMQNIPHKPDSVKFIHFFQESVENLNKLKHACLDPSDKGFKQIEYLELQLEKILSLDEEGSLGLILNELSISADRGNKKNWRSGEACDTQKQLCEQLKHYLEGFRKDVCGNIAMELFRELSGFVNYVQQEKLQRGQLDFHDLLVRARDLLQHNFEVRGHFQERFRHILVDEFQDTDPLQAEIIFFLAEDTPCAARWDDVRLSPGKLFLVGDPKQSIYRFRRADLEIYARAREILAEQGEIIPIVQNFRSVPGVIRWVNETFRPLIQPPDDGNYQPVYEDLHPFRPDEGQAAAVQRLAVGLEPGDSGIDEVRRKEADRIAEAIAALEWTVWEKDTGQWRPSRFGDVAVLFPISSGIEAYEDSLRDRGIPYRLEAGRRFYRRDETVHLAAILSAVDNPRDEPALVGALRSSYFGVSDEEIFLYKANGGILDYQRGCPDESSSLGQAFHLLRELNSVRNTLPPARVMGLLLERTRTLERLSLQTGGRQAVFNLHKLMGQARAFGMAGISFRRFVHWLDRMRREEYQEEDFTASDEEKNAVNLLTIHKAKGLEFPVVILANLMSSPNHGSNCIANWSEGRLDLSLGGSKSGFCTPGYSRALEWNKVREEAEDLRLLYVAATRARDWLVIPDSPAKKKSFGACMKKALDSLPPMAVSVRRTEVTPALTKNDANDGKGEVFPFPKMPGKCAAGDEHPDNVLAHYRRWKEKRERLVVQTPRSINLVTPSGAEKLREGGDTTITPAGPDALDLGRAFHAIMEAVELREGADLERRVRHAATIYSVKGEEDLLLRMALNCLRNPLMARARAARRLFREVPLSVHIEGKIVEGSVDLVIEETDGLVVVDYKTDRVDGSAVEERVSVYRPQLLLYARSLAKASEKPVKEAIILFARTGEAKTLFMDAAMDGTGN
ncbi:MAG: UvrD-helicase domain-containing protein [Deltaproteobacteria bacterium]|nr:UvrD-helicase domain-containing protein [Deltaproteobacteria bacterium]MBW2306319.1 UvrD-helicase domain-containing protein [Deltaproteobacteria bacterium]